MYSQGVLGASSILIAVSENVMAVFQQPLEPNPVSNGMDWISHPIIQPQWPVVYLSRWAMMKVTVGSIRRDHWLESEVRLGDKVDSASDCAPRKRRFFIFPKIATACMYDFFGYLFLDIQTKSQRASGRWPSHRCWPLGKRTDMDWVATVWHTLHYNRPNTLSSAMAQKGQSGPKTYGK